MDVFTIGQSSVHPSWLENTTPTTSSLQRDQLREIVKFPRDNCTTRIQHANLMTRLVHMDCLTQPHVLEKRIMTHCPLPTTDSLDRFMESQKQPTPNTKQPKLQKMHNSETTTSRSLADTTPLDRPAPKYNTFMIDEDQSTEITEHFQLLANTRSHSDWKPPTLADVFVAPQIPTEDETGAPFFIETDEPRSPNFEAMQPNSATTKPESSPVASTPTDLDTSLVHNTPPRTDHTDPFLVQAGQAKVPHTSTSEVKETVDDFEVFVAERMAARAQEMRGDRPTVAPSQPPAAVSSQKSMINNWLDTLLGT